MQDALGILEIYKLITEDRLKQRGYVRGYWQPFSPSEDGSNNSTNQKISLRHVTQQCQYGGCVLWTYYLLYIYRCMFYTFSRLRIEFVHMEHKRVQVINHKPRSKS